MKRVTHPRHDQDIAVPSATAPLPRWLAPLYAAWAGVSFLILAVLALVIVLPVPSLRLRRRMTRRAARFALWVAGMRVRISHDAHLPPGSSVVVANHASYLDGVVLFATLPPVFGFVIKREMNQVPIAGLLLRRIGMHFVDRSGAGQGKRDARALMRQARSGGALAFFPEGTFHREPGLARFRSGAFVIAANAQMPIVPVAIRGTRQALPPGSLLPQPGRIEVELAPALPAPRAGDATAIDAALRAARAAILARIDEPDLDPVPTTDAPARIEETRLVPYG
jgi:1-acyl-sn-glycerol-3-phosphate acyltransferase